MPASNKPSIHKTNRKLNFHEALARLERSVKYRLANPKFLESEPMVESISTDKEPQN